MKLMEQDRFEILVDFFFLVFFGFVNFYFCFYDMLFIDEVSPCKLQTLFKCVATTVLVTGRKKKKGGNEGSVFFSVYLRRGDLLDSRTSRLFYAIEMD